MFRVYKELSKSKIIQQVYENSLINKQRMNFFFKSDRDQPTTTRMLKSLETSKSSISEFKQQMDTWIKNVNNSEYLQQQLISDYYKQFALVLHKRIKLFEDNELHSWKTINQEDLDNLSVIFDQKIKFLEDSISIRQNYFITENLKKDQLKVFWWKLYKNKYQSSIHYKLIHYYPIYLLIGFVLFSIVDLVIITNSKRIGQIQKVFDSQLTQVKSIVDGIISDSQKNIEQNKPETPQIQIAPIHELKQQTKKQ